MFRTITEEPPARPGKFADEKSMFGKGSHFDFGPDKHMEDGATTKNTFTGMRGEKRDQIKPAQA